MFAETWEPSLREAQQPARGTKESCMLTGLSRRRNRSSLTRGLSLCGSRRSAIREGHRLGVEAIDPGDDAGNEGELGHGTVLVPLSRRRRSWNAGVKTTSSSVSLLAARRGGRAFEGSVEPLSATPSRFAAEARLTGLLLGSVTSHLLGFVSVWSPTLGEAEPAP